MIATEWCLNGLVSPTPPTVIVRVSASRCGGEDNHSARSVYQATWNIAQIILHGDERTIKERTVPWLSSCPSSRGADHHPWSNNSFQCRGGVEAIGIESSTGGMFETESPTAKPDCPRKDII